MLPIVTSEIRENLEEVIQTMSDEWKKDMVHHLKEDNPEINSLLLNLAQGSPDPKKVILAGYLVYKSLELAEAGEEI